jgi:hypothetical protein
VGAAGGQADKSRVLVGCWHSDMQQAVTQPTNRAPQLSPTHPHSPARMEKKLLRVLVAPPLPSATSAVPRTSARLVLRAAGSVEWLSMSMAGIRYSSSVASCGVVKFSVCQTCGVGVDCACKAVALCAGCWKASSRPFHSTPQPSN